MEDLIEAKLTTYYLGLHLAGVKLTRSNYDLLISKNLIKGSSIGKYQGLQKNSLQEAYFEKISINKIYNDNVDVPEITRVSSYKNVDELIATGEIKKYDPGKLIRDLKIVTPKELRSDIKRKEWYIQDKTNLSDDFFNWIESIRSGWQFKTKYAPFELYKEQAAYFLSQNSMYPSNGTEEQQLEYVEDERYKMLANSLYGVNKYGKIKEDQSPLGVIDCEAWEVQAFLLYLLDCDLSVLLGKPRQIGSTTVIALAAIIKTMIRRNYYCKLVAQKGKKSEEIFNHKVKFPIENFPYYITPTVANYNGSEVVFKYKSSKGASSASNSIFEVCPPSEDVVNAGTPACTLLDEIGLNDLLQQIIDNGRPTIFWHNPTSGKLELRRQMFGWGTADASSPMFELVYKSAKEQWLQKNYRYGIIPIFINSYAKPGFTEDHYLSEKSYYYTQKKVPGKIDPKIMFHQTYPIVEDDMWLVSDDTVVPTMYIKKREEKLRETEHKNVKGYFEPIYNTRIKRDDDFIPYRIIGAKFIPASQDQIDDESPFASVTIMHKPLDGWRNRYYQGIDPIFSSSGHSRMAGYIWDTTLKHDCAYFSGKTSDYRFCYLQCLLLNLHYSMKDGERMTGIRQLLEINVGGEYANFVNDHKYSHTLVANTMLPDQFQTSSVDTGIRKQGNNSKNLVTTLEQLINNYGDNISSTRVWEQLRTFVKKHTRTGQKYEPQDLRIHYDDDIDGLTYAYLNAESHRHLKPVHISFEKEQKQKRNVLRYQMNSNFELTLTRGRA